MFTLWSDIDRFFNNSFADLMLDGAMTRRMGTGANLSNSTRMNLIDKGDTLEFVAELPGVNDSDMNLSVHNDTLTLKAKRAISRDKENNVYLAERTNYNLQRSVALPVRVDADKTTATFKNGVLRVVLPKSSDNLPKQIAINA